jgi:hypothetical protein
LKIYPIIFFSTINSQDEFNGNNISNKIKGLWRRFDNNFMKPLFIADWPYVKEDHDEISRKIISVFEEHQRKKIKSKEMKDISYISTRSKDKSESLLFDPNRK